MADPGYRFALISCMILVLLGTFPPTGSAQNTVETVTIAFVADGQSHLIDEVIDLFESEITELLSGEFEVHFPAEKVTYGDWTEATSREQMHALLEDDEVDMVISVGLLTSAMALQVPDPPKPLIAPFVHDVRLFGAPYQEGASGVENLTYIATPSNFRSDLASFRAITPFDHVTIIVNDITENSLARLQIAGLEVAEEFGLEVDWIAAGDSPEEVLASIPASSEAVVLTPLLMFDEAAFQRLVQGLIERKLPSWSLLGKLDVERGILASDVGEDFLLRRARRTALNIQRILLGEAAGSLPVNFADRYRLTINMRTARLIDVYPPYEILTEAEVINPQREITDRQWDLHSAMREAVRVNVELLAKDQEVLAGKQQVRKAWANLLPQLTAGASYAVIDEERAAGSFGQQAERTASLGGELQQVIFSEAAIANVGIQRQLQLSRRQEWERVRLDIAHEAARAYLNVLRALMLERIQQNNLKLTRSNLEMARVREAIGSAGPGEVYRWEAQIATDRINAINANSQRNLAEIQFNRLLHRPLEEHFTAEEPDLQDPRDVLFGLLPYIEDQRRFKLLRKFGVKLGLEHSPEIGQIENALAAQERALRSNRNALFMPTVGLQARLDHVLDRGGAGSTVEPIEMMGQQIQFGSEPEDLSWSVGVSASLPLFEGTARYARIREAEHTVEQLQLQRTQVAEGIEQRIRSAFHVAGASFAAISLSEDRARAAEKTLELVTDAYARGAASILELIDAQNAALQAEMGYTDAVYGFLMDFMEVQRSLGVFYNLEGEEAVSELMARLEAYFDEEMR